MTYDDDDSGGDITHPESGGGIVAPVANSAVAIEHGLELEDALHERPVLPGGLVEALGRLLSGDEEEACVFLKLWYYW